MPIYLEKPTIQFSYLSLRHPLAPKRDLDIEPLTLSLNQFSYALPNAILADSSSVWVSFRNALLFLHVQMVRMMERKIVLQGIFSLFS